MQQPLVFLGAVDLSPRHVPLSEGQITSAGQNRIDAGWLQGVVGEQESGSAQIRQDSGEGLGEPDANAELECFRHTPRPHPLPGLFQTHAKTG